jgi:hypothetical protein
VLSAVAHLQRKILMVGFRDSIAMKKAATSQARVMMREAMTSHWMAVVTALFFRRSCRIRGQGASQFQGGQPGHHHEPKRVQDRSCQKQANGGLSEAHLLAELHVKSRPGNAPRQKQRRSC